MASLRRAIDAKCRSCIYDPGCGGGGWREQVAACSSANCPLHPVRPQIAAKSGRGAREGQRKAVAHTTAVRGAKGAAKSARIGGAG
jgi:hypothetical protein